MRSKILQFFLLGLLHLLTFAYKQKRTSLNRPMKKQLLHLDQYKSFIYATRLYDSGDLKNLTNRSVNKLQPNRRLQMVSSNARNAKSNYNPTETNTADAWEYKNYLNHLMFAREFESIPWKQIPTTRNSQSKYRNPVHRKNDGSFSYFESVIDPPPRSEWFPDSNEIADDIDGYALRKKALQKYQPQQKRLSNQQLFDTYKGNERYWITDESEEGGQKIRPARPNRNYEIRNTLKDFDALDGSKYIVVENAGQNNIDRYIGPLIGSHVVTTSIHPWVFPFFFGLAEPYVSFMTFFITAIIELFGLFIGSGFMLFGYRGFNGLLTDGSNDNVNTNSNIGAITAAVGGASAVGIENHIFFRSISIL